MRHILTTYPFIFFSFFKGGQWYVYYLFKIFLIGIQLNHFSPSSPLRYLPANLLHELYFNPLALYKLLLLIIHHIMHYIYFNFPVIFSFNTASKIYLKLASKLSFRITLISFEYAH